MNKIHHIDLTGLADYHFNLVCPKPKHPLPSKPFKKSSIYQKLKDSLPAKSSKEYPLLYYLMSNVENVITGEVSEMEIVIRDVKRIMRKQGLAFTKSIGHRTKRKEVKTNLLKKLQHCFDYEGFSKSSKPYAILKLLDVSCCPYCNRTYVSTFISKSGRTRATLDHFFSKSKYPYLALSFYNLIPSCYSCNSNLKLDKNFSFNSHMNPYFESFEGIKTFSIDFQKIKKKSDQYIAEYYANEKFMKIILIPSITATRKQIKKADANIRDFKIEKLYNLHKDHVVELLQKNVVYIKNGYARVLAKQFPQIFNTTNDVFKLLFDNYVKEKDFNKRPFSRMTRDISKELGLLSRLA